MLDVRVELRGTCVDLHSWIDPHSSLLYNLLLNSLFHFLLLFTTFLTFYGFLELADILN
ncbi:hypothetical protein BDN70DRAFT_663304 [Pholiota conissans]|uniref:Uncharacterized protein n=1 Tax=Pholiota conissans TaxID=109636 RepID=A0A9P6D1L3_9AGAR|nr:hypothetical protein BDN70DRAFT_663304 [Pholiota conissans]